jgi:hypothetical protein
MLKFDYLSEIIASVVYWIISLNPQVNAHNPFYALPLTIAVLVHIARNLFF